MHFEYSKENLKGREKFLQRLFEMLPGLMSWTILLGMIFLSFFQPLIAAVMIIAFYLFWLFKIIFMSLFLFLSYLRLKMEAKTDWMKRIAALEHLEKPAACASSLSFHIHRRELISLQKNRDPIPRFEDIHHLIIYPIAKEGREIVEPAIQSLIRQPFPTKRMVVFLAVEDRADEEIKKDISSLEKEFKDKFFHIQTIFHPADIKNEARVKGANATYAAKEAAQFFKEKKIPFENIIVSCFDADTVVSPQYFTCLTYYYMITPERVHASFQPIPVYHNNIWDVPGFARVIEIGSSFFQLIEATNPETLVTFSSHSMSFKALEDVGFWPVDMISDDSAIYWKSFIHYDGKYKVVPLYVTLSMDIAGSQRFWETAQMVYKQKRRWAWGAENIPLVMRAFLKASKISPRDRLRCGFKLFEGHVSWATWGFLLSFIGWLPGLFAQQEFSTSVMYYTTPRINFIIFRLASFSLILSIILSIGLLPKKHGRYSLRKKIGHALEWLMLPFILVFFSALPALDAQTRLMFGKYMEFWVTDKKRKA